MSRVLSREPRRPRRILKEPPGNARRPVTRRRDLPDPARRAARALRDFTHSLAHATSEHEILERACSDLVRLAGYRMAWIGLALHDERSSIRPVAQAGIADGYLEQIDVGWADDARGHGPAGTAIRTRLPVVVHNILTDPTFERWRLAALRRGYSSSASIPLVGEHGPSLGALNVYAGEPDAFDRQEVEVLRQLAVALTLALKARR